MLSPTEFVDTHRPAGGRRSGKRDLIVNVFLRQEGHLTADDLYDLIKREDQKISRATVYRTLQWMVDAGIARRVDFGEGRFRFEHAYRHPRHFHLICRQCQQSYEFLSSDIESLVEEVAATRRFTAQESVIQIYGICESCSAGRPSADEPDSVEALFARDALRVAIATERSGLTFYTRAAKKARDARGRAVFERLAAEEREHLGTLETRYRELVAADPTLESRPAFLFFKGASDGLFAAGAEELMQNGIGDRQALLIGIRCERASHRFFKKYGERFEESEGKRIFLEFAAEEREHCDLLVREYKGLLQRERHRAQAPRTRRRA
jgi:Fur family ferric uptake transcriptional regulator